MAIIYPSLRKIIFSICVAIFMLDILTPANYVFGHLYVVPMLLTACKLYARKVSFPKIIAATTHVTQAAVFLVLVNFTLFATGLLQAIGIEGLHPAIFSFAILVNACNVIAVLFLTDWLIRASLKYMQRIDIQDREIEFKQAELIIKQTELVSQQEIERIQQDFIYTLTHDLKTPIVGAIRVLEYFEQGKYGEIDCQQLKILNMLARSQRRLYQLVQTLLDIYRNDNHGLILDLQPIDLCEIAAEAISSMEILAADRQIKLQLNCKAIAKFPHRLIGDPLQLNRVFNNLIANAIYHAPNHSSIEVAIEYQDGYFTTCITDRGQGIDPADRPFLFDRFYQAHNKLTGSGLGLYLSRQIVAAHHGEIWAESAQPQGAKFCFRLPAVANFINNASC